MAQIYIFLIAFILARAQVGIQPKSRPNGDLETGKDSDGSHGVPSMQISIQTNLTRANEAKNRPKTNNATTEKTDASGDAIIDGNVNKNLFKSRNVESGAVRRGALVFLGIGLIFIVYVGIKTYRNRKRSNLVVRKYGVRTKRSDVEMTPLPLDNDDDDDTVFDLKNVNLH